MTDTAVAAPKLQKVPTVNVKELSKENLATVTDLKENKDIRVTSKQIEVPFEKIRVRKDFNLRKDFGDITGLADSIEARGLENPIVVDVMTDGIVVLHSGERRYRAIQLLREKSKDLKERFELIPARVNDRDLTEQDRLIMELNSNSGKNLEPLEEAEGFKMLRDDYKMNLPEMAKQTGRSIPFIEQRLILVDNPEIKEGVKEKSISPTAAVQLARRIKDTEGRKSVIKEAKATGKKVKVKQAKGAPAEKKPRVNKASLVEICDESLALIKEADAANKNQKVTEFLISLSKKIREIKKALK